jgi:DNA mismatch repair ATPase MutS
MEYAALAAVLFLLVIFFMITGKIEERKAKRLFRSRLKSCYGAFSDKKYAEGRMESIKALLRCNPETDFVIDDITWNDLEMDRLFQAIDYTRSAAGEEALYRWLRTPVFEEEMLQKREHHFRFLEEHEEDRLDYLSFMADIGRTGKYSVYDYLDYLDTLPDKSCLFKKLADIAIVLCLILGLTVTAYFFLPMVILLLYNSITYMRQKKEIEPYLLTFSYFVRIFDNIRRLNGMSAVFQEEFAQEIGQLQAAKNEFSSFKRWSFLALDDTGGANPMDLSRLILTYLKFMFHLDLIKFYSMLHVLKEKKEVLMQLFQNMGEIEAAISVVYARAAFGVYSVPTLQKQQNPKEIVLEAEDLFHPLIPNPVPNSVCQHRGMLLTGSNASGKSTFLKAVAVNVLLAQTIHTACAKSYRANYFRIYSSMALRDSLQQGESYFIVEIKSMKRIFDAAEDGGIPVLCTIDEVLRGTNTAERIGASAELLKALARKGVLCFAATHDLELTTLLEQDMDNYHFEEMVEGKDIHFPYQLTKGCARGRNAIKLLGAFGFDEDLVERAEKLAGGFK